MSVERPYFSVVAAARNDDHGGNFLRRLQIFVNALAVQARRYALPAELLLVEWNPPNDRPSLIQAVRWPESGPCRIRVLTVPPSIHRRYRLHDSLPLYQMIAKNAGIRRAAGEYILATNVDIVLSDELMKFIAGRRLEEGKTYRVDRFDVSPDVPGDAPLDEQLSYCRTHCIRVNAREGTFALTNEGFRQLAAEDVTSPANGIFFGRGWYSAQQHFGQLYRRVANEAEIRVRPSGTSRVMRLDMRPGPTTEATAFKLRILEAGGKPLGEAYGEGHSTIRLLVPAGIDRFGLSFTGADQGTATAQRTPGFQAFQCGWEDSPPSEDRVIEVSPYRKQILAGSWRTARRGFEFVRQMRRTGRPGRIGLPLNSRVLAAFRARPVDGGLAISLGGPSAGGSPLPNTSPADLHTNACGDFTLAHRNHWLELRGYPEFDLYSMNIDSVFCYMAHYGGARECVLPEPMRVYHIEHAAGSGWTPEGESALFQRLAAKGIPWLAFDQVLDWASQMERFRCTMVFNRDEWGLAGDKLIETDPGHA